ncbi:MAG TPA: Trk system potassium transporter TrkA [Candidatus Fournierella merdavium]|uniref:Trk system potassium transporter TrkA n=1 Tax=Candidatus Allofournierella merdavium TaxID=2838593 RepID=UPI001F98FF9E|nr:Trk system potassium transporter TrkA [Candidatus Fournierella merdavium]
MKIIIAGDGKVGLALTRQLLHEGHEVTIVDSNPVVLQTNMYQYDVLAVQGNAATMEALRQARVEQADLLIAATSADEINLLCCVTAKKMNSRLHTIARVRNPDYTEQLFVMREELGLSMTINPELSAAREIFHLLQFPSFLHRDSFAKGRVEIVGLRVDEHSRLDGVPLHQLYKIAQVKVLVCAVLRSGRAFIPDGSFQLKKGDRIFVTARAVNLAQLIKNLGIAEQKIRRVLLVGGGHISFYLAQRLLDAGLSVKIIEQNPARARFLAENLPRASVVLGDGSSRSLLESEGLAQANALVSLTGMDEENIVLSMFARSQGVPKVVTKVNRLEYGHMFEELDIGSIVSPKELTSALIARYVRSMQNKTGKILTLHPIAEGNAAAMEFRVDESVLYRCVALKDVPLRRGVLISCITHSGTTIIPDGTSHFDVGDTVVAVSTLDAPVQQMNDLFV